MDPLHNVKWWTQVIAEELAKPDPCAFRMREYALQLSVALADEVRRLVKVAHAS